MVSYKELGLVNTRDMFAKAIKGGYAIPAFNFNSYDASHPMLRGFYYRLQTILKDWEDSLNRSTILTIIAQEGTVECLSATLHGR